jgi:hypothetical protein
MGWGCPRGIFAHLMGGVAIPLTRLKDEYLEQDGVRFLMEDEAGAARKE